MITQMLLEFQQALANKAAKISGSDPAYVLGVTRIPESFKKILTSSAPSKHWAFEGSVGKGSWSRTPWIAVFDERATSRASDGFFIAALFSEDIKSVFLVLMNTSSNHHNFTPYKLSQNDAGTLIGFEVGSIPKKHLSESGRGSGPDFETASLLWKKFSLTSEGIINFEDNLTKLALHYLKLVEKFMINFPKEKPFKENLFLIR